MMPTVDLAEVSLRDFNQMLRLPLGGAGRRPHLRDLLVEESIEGRGIAVAGHCYGCTAGQGSSCGGALDSSQPRAIRKTVG